MPENKPIGADPALSYPATLPAGTRLVPEPAPGEGAYTPTPRLRYVMREWESEPADDGEELAFEILGGTMPVLQQFWSDGLGGGEWRDVPTATEE